MADVENGSAPTLQADTVQRVRRGTRWTLAGYILGEVLRFGGNLILVRLLAREYFGIMVVVNAVLRGLVLFSDVGLGPCIIHSPRSDRVFLDTAWTISVLRGVLLFLLAIPVSLFVASFYETPELGSLMPVAACTVLLAGTNSINIFTANRNLAMPRLVLLDLANRVTIQVVMITWALIHPSVWALVGGSVAGAGVKSLLSHFFLPGGRCRLHWDWQVADSIVRFGRWIFLSTLMMYAAAESDRLIIPKLISMAEVGVYGIAVMLITAPTTVVAVINDKILFPLFSRIHRDQGDLAGILRRTRWRTLTLSGWMISGIIAGGPCIVAILYPPGYVDAGWEMQILAAGIWFGVVLCGPNGAAILAMGKPNWTAAGSATTAGGVGTFLLLGYAVGGFPWALAGVAFAQLLRYCVFGYASWRFRFPCWDQDLKLTAILGAAALAGWQATVQAGSVLTDWSAALAGPVRWLVGLVGVEWTGTVKVQFLQAPLIFLVVTIIWLPWMVPVLRELKKRP